MNFLNKFKFPALAVIFLVATLLSCEEDLTSIGAEVIGGEPFKTGKVVYNVSATNNKINAVQTNQLPVYQLGQYNDPIYGKTKATITSQVQLPASTIFGVTSQDDELNDVDEINENETIDSVVVYIPYFTNTLDSDSDGVPDALESDDDILDSTNDTDGDGVANNVEVANGTNPQVKDTDGDGIEDDTDETNDALTFAKTLQLDSIYGDRSAPFTFKIERSTYFLRDVDPNSNFQDSQEYYSNQQFSPDFTDEVFYEGENTISATQYLIAGEEDDPDTSDVDETSLIALDPGLRVKLNEEGIAYFQQNILDKEGSSELLSASNFKEFFRGVHLSVTPSSEELLFFLNMSNAKIDVYYHYDEEEDGEKTVEQDSFTLSMFTSGVSNAINTFECDEYPAEIAEAMNSSENASRIYLKGGSGTFAEIDLFDSEEEINQIKANNWVINEAHLVFYIDQDVVGTEAIEPPRLYLFNSETNAPIYNAENEVSDSDSALGIYLNYDGLLEESSGRGLKYTVNITEHLNDIIVRDSVNSTLGLQITSDIRISGANNAVLENGDERDLPAAAILSPLGTVLYGNNVQPVEEAKKLQLEIFYTEIN